MDRALGFQALEPMVLSRWTKLGSHIVMPWLLGIADNLISESRFYELAVRDIEIAVGAFALSQLTVVRELRGSSNATAAVIGSPTSLTL